MVMTFDNMRHRYADQEIPKANLSKPAPVNYLREHAREDDAGPPNGTHVHVHYPSEDTCVADVADRLADVEDAVAKIVEDHYRFDEAGPAPLINQSGWNTKGHTLTGGSQSLPPSSTAAGPEYMPNAAGSIDEPTRQSFTPKQLDPGKLWGATTDAMYRAEVYKHQMRQTNAAINSIQAKNAAFYAKRG